MGVDIHVHICKYNPEDNFYHELSLYRHREENEKYNYDVRPQEENEKYNYDVEGNRILIEDEYEKIPPYDGRNYEMFSGMRGESENSGYGIFPSYPITLNSLEPKLRKEIEEKKNLLGFYDFNEIFFSDFVNYLHDYPTVVDYDSDDWEDWKTTDAKPQKENPLKRFFESCVSYANFAERYGMYEPYSWYKILYWFDN